ncbi:penicillin-binding protein 1C [Thalassolituus sp. LLYu03]|uniref:penicillin-binding protein 1C n=1 Tax=Thalassolituus sp. LLYu03 TaxID=3421656 RepID=UPI003D2CA731
MQVRRLSAGVKQALHTGGSLIRRRPATAALLLPLIVVVLALLVADVIWPLRVPLPLPQPGSARASDLEHSTPASADDFARLVVDRHGRPLRAFADADGVWRYPLALNDVAPVYLDALLSYEDRWFYWHPGVNPLALLRASWQNWRCHCVVSGGSTITMQVARRFYPHARTLSGKLQQVLRALQLEWHLSKDQILNLYLNYVPMGGTVEGVGAGARLYLDKPAQQLSLAEAALLAVLPQTPSRLRPDRYPRAAEAARNKVLARMKAFGRISDADYRAALLEPVVAYALEAPRLAPLLARRLRTENPEPLIRTTLDADLQAGLEALLLQDIRQFPAAHSAAVLVVDNRSHEVLAYLGSADFTDNSRFGHVDMVQAQRSPGSTVKPFIYGLAIDDGLIHSASLLRDVPRRFSDYQPDNFSGGFSGPVSATEALRQSLNVPAVQVLEALTPARLNAALINAGVPYRLPAGSAPNLAMALGGGGLSLAGLVQLYSGLANGGLVTPLKLRPDDAMPARWLMSPEAAWVTLKMLQTPRPDRVDSRFTVQAPQPIAWKTGTSYGFRDAWAVGVTPQYTIGVWLGRPDGTPAPGHYGAVSALPLMFRLFDRLDPAAGDFPRPEGVTDDWICWPLGTLAAENRRDDCLQSQRAWLVRRQIPPTLADEQGDGLARNPLPFRVSERGLLVDEHCQTVSQERRAMAVWPRSLEPWVPVSQRLRNRLPAPDPRCPTPPALAVSPLRIIGVRQDSVLRSSRQAQGASLNFPEISLTAQGGLGVRDWFVDGAYAGSSGEAESLIYRFHQSGRHELVVMDRLSNLDRLSLVVE